MLQLHKLIGNALSRFVSDLFQQLWIRNRLIILHEIAEMVFTESRGKQDEYRESLSVKIQYSKYYELSSVGTSYIVEGRKQTNVRLTSTFSDLIH